MLPQNNESSLAPTDLSSYKSNSCRWKLISWPCVYFYEIIISTFVLAFPIHTQFVPVMCAKKPLPPLILNEITSMADNLIQNV